MNTIWSFCQDDQRYLSKGGGYLLYQIADEIVTNTLKVIDDMDDQIDQIEDDIFTNPQTAILEHIFSVKRTLLGLRRSLLPQREVFNKLARGDFDLIQEPDRVYFRDVYDHMVRMQEMNESLRDLVSSALETYLSMINNRMNEIMKVLTNIATIFNNNVNPSHLQIAATDGELFNRIKFLMLENRTRLPITNVILGLFISILTISGGSRKSGIPETKTPPGL